MKIRLVKFSDLEKIVHIYNQSIPSMGATGDITPLIWEERIPWLNSHLPEKCPIYVAVMNGNIVGYISMSMYRNGRSAFRFVSEISYYVDNKYHRTGIGSKLIDFIIQKCELLKIKTLITFVMEHNQPSIHLLNNFGFEKWGVLPNIADFKGKEFNHTIYGLRIKDQ